LRKFLNEDELRQAANYLYDPGISILREARLALSSGRVTAMHDPTEGGLIAALWELAEASRQTLWVDLKLVPVPELSSRICETLGINPLAAIASGSLLLTAPAADAMKICHALEAEGVPCAEIGGVEAGPPVVWEITRSGRQSLRRPERDEIARLF
jgi:hydrogenase maturation factor